MARIPIYQQRVTPNGPGAPANMQGVRVASEGAGLEAIGRGIGQLADVVERREQVDFSLEKDRIETEGRVWFANASSKADLDQAEYLRQSQQSAKPGAPGFTPEYLKQYDDYAKGAADNAPSQFARQLMQAHLSRSREAYGKAAMAFEAGERARYTGQQIDEGVQTSAKLIYNNPALFENEMGKWGSTINGVAVPEEAKQKMRDVARKNLAWSAIIGSIDRNPLAWDERRAEAAPAPAAAPAFGARPDGSQKGTGWLGVLNLPNGDVATEYSMQSDAVKKDGKRVDFPTLVPTLTKSEVDLMVKDIIPNGKDIPEPIVQKAIAHAKARLAEGKSPFADEVSTAAKPVGVSAADQQRLAAFKIAPEQDAVLQSVSGGNATKAAFLRTVLTIENRGFGGVRSDAVSPAGAVGPFQFIATTGKQYGLQNDADRKDFGKSAQAAARYYDDLEKRYDGNVLAMVAEYNGGIKAAQAVMAGKEPPAKETRDYVAMARYLMPAEQPAAPAAAAAAPAAAAAAPAPAAEIDRGPAWNLLTLDEQLKAREYARRKIDHLRQNSAVSLRYDIQNAESMARNGVPPTGPERTRQEFALAFNDPMTAEHEWQRYRQARQTASAVSSLQGRTTAELLGVIQAQPNAADPNFAVTASNMAVQAKAAAEIIRDRQTDPVAHAIQTGDFGLKPLDPQQPAAFAEELKRRTAALPGMAERYGVANVLSKPEAQMLAMNMEVLPADRRVAQFESIRKSISDDTIYGRILDAIRPDSPVTALVGNIAATGASENARLIAIGEDLLNPTKGGKKTDGTGAGARFPMPQETLMRQAWVDAVGEAYRGYPQAEATAYQAFKAYYAARASQKGLNDPKASPDDKIIKDAVQASTGGIMRWRTDWFGNSTPSANVVLPYGMPVDKFRDAVKAEWLRVRNAAGYSKTDVGDIGLFNTGANGEYMVMSGTSWLPGKDKNPIILRIAPTATPTAAPAPTAAPTPAPAPAAAPARGVAAPASAPALEDLGGRRSRMAPAPARGVATGSW